MVIKRLVLMAMPEGTLRYPRPSRNKRRDYMKAVFKIYTKPLTN